MKGQYTVALSILAGAAIGAAATQALHAQAKPPKLIAIMAFESLEKAQATFDSPAYKEAKKAGDKYATFTDYSETPVG